MAVFRKNENRIGAYLWGVTLLLCLSSFFVYRSLDDKLANGILAERKAMCELHLKKFGVVMGLPYWYVPTYPSAGYCYHNHCDTHFRTVSEKYTPIGPITGSERTEPILRRVLCFSGELIAPLLRIGQSLDLFHVVMILGSIMSLFLSHAAYSGQKDVGTLPLIFSNPVSRLGYFFFVLKSFLYKNALFVFLCFIPLGGCSIQQLHLNHWYLAVGMFFFLCIFSLLGVAISLYSKNSIQSVFGVFLVWLVVIILYPSITENYVQSRFLVEQKAPYLTTQSALDESSPFCRAARHIEVLSYISPAQQLEAIFSAIACKDVPAIQRVAAAAERNSEEQRIWFSRNAKKLKSTLKLLNPQDEGIIQPYWEPTPSTWQLLETLPSGTDTFPPPKNRVPVWPHLGILLTMAACLFLVCILRVVTMDCRHKP